MVTVVVGGQYGSEGKGKVAQYVAAQERAAAVVRVGGSNSGHTGYSAVGTRVVLRQLPTAALLREPLCVLGAGSYLDVDLLAQEIELTGLHEDRLLIDSNAMVITQEDRDREARSRLGERIGSTQSGTGASVLRRIERRADNQRACDVPALRPFVTNVSERLRELIDSGARVIVEGTQGFGLSVLHSPHYPHATSRDTTAAGALAEAGLSPRDVDDVVMVIRSFPIRVAGNSGPLERETDWATVARAAGSKEEFQEFTSVTGLLRRVARFDPAIVRRAIAVNKPSAIVLNHVDYVDVSCRESGELTAKARAFVDSVSQAIAAPITCVGLGPTAMVNLGRKYALAS